jgi:hypothetical protein
MVILTTISGGLRKRIFLIRGVQRAEIGVYG